MTEEEKKEKELEQQSETAAVAAEQPEQPSAYDKLMAAYEERQKKDERSDKLDRIRTAIAGIGDTVGALGNLYFTTQYASPIPQTDGMSDKMRERYEAAKAKRDRNRAEWMNYALNIAGRKQAADQAEMARKDRKEQNDRIWEWKVKEAQEKKDNEEDEAYITPLIYGWANKIENPEGNFDEKAEEKRLSEELKDNPRRLKKALQALRETTEKTRYALDSAARESQQRVQEAAEKSKFRSSGSGSGSDQYIYIGFGDGDGVNIRKNDKDSIKAAYDMLPSRFKSYIDKSTEYEYKVRAYLLSNPNTPEAEAIKKHLRQTSKRQQKPTKESSGKGTGYDSKNGKGKGY